MTTPAYILGPNPAVVKRCRDERTVTPGLSQSNQVRETTDSTTCDECRSRRRRSHARDHGHVRTGRFTDSCEVEHDHRAHTGVNSASREIARLTGRDVQPWRDRNPIAQVETEGHRRADSANGIRRRDTCLVQRDAYRRQDIERLERFETDNDLRGAESERLTRARRRGDRGVQPERRDRCQARDERFVWQEVRRFSWLLRLRLRRDRVEVGRIQLGKAQPIDIRTCESDRIPIDRAAGCNPDRRIAGTHSASCVYRSAAGQINDADQSQGRTSWASLEPAPPPRSGRLQPALSGPPEGGRYVQ